MRNSQYARCCLCPRQCGVNRETGERGICGETSALRLAFAGIHFGEEPPITGAGGSGTIFVSGCNLGCAFCQNFQISQGNPISHRNSISKNIVSGLPLGREVDTAEFALICLVLQKKGAENINIVTGSHAAPALAAGIKAAREQGLAVPILWNSSGYDGNESLKILENIIDVYLPDLKTLDPATAKKFFNAPDYPEHAAAAILKMMEQKPIMAHNVMIRHLVIPGFLENTRQVLAWFSKNCVGKIDADNNCRGKAQLSLMTQYTPVNIPGIDIKIPANFVSGDEYNEVLLMLDEFGIEEGFCQELVTGSDWLPDFTRPNPFSSELSIPVWHWSDLHFFKNNL